ncbi:MAG: diacylglycerol kinase family protein [Candidatus Neomarinimicrobiota bacterium]|jgi:YegS/Rv2252/BmrU family lipid kinase
MQIQLICNPNSGAKKGDKLYPKIYKMLIDAGHTVIPYKTLYRFHAKEIAKHIDLNACDLVLSVGGDGTAHEVLNGLMQNTSSDKHPLFGLIPVGTGNSFAQDLNFKNWKDGIKAISEGKTIDLDIMKISSGAEPHYSMNCTGFGFVADVNLTGNKMKRFFGKTAYTLGALIEILRFKPHKCIVEVDGVRHEYNGVLTNFSNSVWIAGNMKISPTSVLNDGLLECLILHALPKHKLLKVFPKVFDGSHLSLDEFEILQGKHFKAWSDPEKVTNPDGEIFGVTPLEISILPKEFKILSL